MPIDLEPDIAASRLAVLNSRDLPHLFYTGDDLATRAMCHLGLWDRGASLDQPLREEGLLGDASSRSRLNSCQLPA